MRIRLSMALLGPCLVAFTGCAGPTVRPMAERDAEIAVGIQDAIRFESESGPLDVTGGASATLSLATTVRTSLATSPAIQAALSRVRIAQADAQQARLLPNPVLNVAFRYPEGGGKPIIEAGLAGELVALLRRPGLSSAADNRLRAASREAVKVVLDTVAEAQEHYVSVQALDAELAVLAERRGFTDRLLKLAQARLEGGEGTRLDVLTLEAQSVELETELSDKDLERREKRLSLTRHIAQPSGEAIWKLESWSMTDRPMPAETLWVRAALAHRPEVQAQELQIAALGGDLAVARLSPFADSAVGVDAERDGEWSLGPAVSIPIPLFDTGGAQCGRAKAAIIEARHKLVEAQRQVVEETRRAYAALAASNQNLKRIRDELIPVQERRREQAEAQFRGGQADVTALILAEVELRAARIRLIEVEKRASTSLIRLERAVGGAGIAASLDDGAESNEQK